MVSRSQNLFLLCCCIHEHTERALKRGSRGVPAPAQVILQQPGSATGQVTRTDRGTHTCNGIMCHRDALMRRRLWTRSPAIHPHRYVCIQQGDSYLQ